MSITIPGHKPMPHHEDKLYHEHMEHKAHGGHVDGSHKEHFIQGAIKHPGVEKAAAARAGMSTHTYMEAHKHDSGTAGKRARLGLTLSKMHHHRHQGK